MDALKVTKKSWLYIVLISLALLFHVFNNLQLNENIKIFHLFALAGIIFGLLIRKQKNQITTNFWKFVGWTILSCAISPIQESYMAGLKFLIVVWAAFYITQIPLKGLVKVINIITPIVLISLIRLYFLEPVYRFQGFYEDPNYMCTTLLVLYFFIQLLWKQNSSRLIQGILVVEMVLILFIITTSISRTGILCFGLMTIVFWWDMFKRNKAKSLLGLTVIVGIIYYYNQDFVENAITGYLVRETENSDTLSGASNLRWEISMRGLSYIFAHPAFLFQGIGIGSFRFATVLDGWHAATAHIDHNTITSCITEQGIVGFILYARFVFSIFKNLKANTALREMSMYVPCLCALFVFLLFSASIYQFSYLPFWFLLMTLASISTQSEKQII